MPLIARTEERELDGDDLLVTVFLSGRLSTKGAQRTAMIRARSEAGMPVPPMFRSQAMGPMAGMFFERTSVEESDLQRAGPFVRGTVTVRVKGVK